MPVTREDVERIIASVPGFRTHWEGFLKEWETETSLPYYVGMGELAHYVVEDYLRGFTKEFPDLFSTVEALLQNPHPEFENLITVGFFENIRNIASHRRFGAEVFRQWLGTRSAVIWDEIDAYMRRVAVWTEKQKPRWWQFWRRHKTFDSEKALSQVENPELKKIIESMYRKKTVI
jgi:hypothetical protein